MSDQIARFWSKVEVRAVDKCWNWAAGRSGGRDGKSYGIFKTSHPRRDVYAHRYAFCLSNGLNVHDLLREIVVRHSCDNGLCCNPNHLIQGTQKDNATDMKIRDRSTRGERSASHKLTEQDVHQVRRLLATGMKHADIAAMFGVSRAAISQINIGKNWAWMPEKETA